jgi:ribonuclease Y
MEVIIGIVAALVGGVSAFSYVKYIKKWVDIKNIPEEEIARVANKIIGDKISEAEKEIEENKHKSEERLRELRKETDEHEELLLEREKKLNERTKMLDKKSEELDVTSEAMKKMQRGLEKSRAQLKEELERISGLTQEEAKDNLIYKILIYSFIFKK